MVPDYTETSGGPHAFLHSFIHLSFQSHIPLSHSLSLSPNEVLLLPPLADRVRLGV